MRKNIINLGVTQKSIGKKIKLENSEKWLTNLKITSNMQNNKRTETFIPTEEWQQSHFSFFIPMGEWSEPFFFYTTKYEHERERERGICRSM